MREKYPATPSLFLDIAIRGLRIYGASSLLRWHPRNRQMPPSVYGHQPEPETKSYADNGRCCGRRVQYVTYNHHGGTSERGEGIQVSAQDDWNLGDEDVTHHTTTDSANHSQDCRQSGDGRKRPYSRQSPTRSSGYIFGFVQPVGENRHVLEMRNRFWSRRRTRAPGLHSSTPGTCRTSQRSACRRDTTVEP
jgi:hypothetical protein